MIGDTEQKISSAVKSQWD